MKRIVTLLLAAGLVLGAAASSQAADIKAKGQWDFSFDMATRGSDGSFGKSGGDTFGAQQRLRTQIDVIASESLKGVLFLEIGHTNWGRTSQGGALGTDGMNIEVRYSYIDWVIPQTEVKVRVGLQNFTLPNFTSGSPILGGGGADGAGITMAGNFTDNFGASLFWLRAENNNANDTTSGYKYNGNSYSDAMDFVGLTLPITFDGVKVTPWGMYGMIGRDSFDGAGEQKKVSSGLLPANVAGLTPGSTDDRHGNAWWVGVASELTLFNPIRIGLDAAYGSVDMGEQGKMDLKRSGWFASIIGEYKLDFMTPGLLFWYSSGDNADINDGSERLPYIKTSWAPSSYGYDGAYYNAKSCLFGDSMNASMGVYAQLKDISFIEDLTHVFRVGFIKGTNNTEMVRQGAASLYDAYGDVYMTTADQAWEVNFDTEYAIYKDLTLCVELGYINLDLGDVWNARTDYNENNFRGGVSLRYAF